MEILLVEDDDDHARLERRALERAELGSVHRVGSFQDALDLAAEVDLDLAIVDHRLPDGDGITLLKRLRARDPALPVLFVTGEGSEEVAHEAIRHGAVDYLTKGTDLADRLTRAVREVVEEWAFDGPAVQIASGGQAETDTESPRRGRQELDTETLAAELAEIVGGPIEGALALDGRGRLLAREVPDDVPAEEIGRVLSRVHEAVGDLRKTESIQPRRYGLVVETNDRLLALAAAPGPLLVVLMLKGSAGTMMGLRRVQEAAKRAWEAS